MTSAFISFSQLVESEGNIGKWPVKVMVRTFLSKAHSETVGKRCSCRFNSLFWSDHKFCQLENVGKKNKGHHVPWACSPQTADKHMRQTTSAHVTIIM